MALLAAGALLSAQIVSPANDPTHASQPLESGTKSTPFSLKLPSGAACAHDSANGGYRVQSFMVASKVDALTLTYDASGPTPGTTGANFRQPLYSVSADPFVDAQTAPSAKKDDPGVVVNIPAFNLNAFMPGDIPAGKYKLGIACTKGPASDTQLDRLWQTTFTVDADGGWTTRDAVTPAGAATTSTPTPVGDASALPPAPAVEANAADTASAPPVDELSGSPGGDPSFSLPAINGVSLPTFGSKAGVLVWLALGFAFLRAVLLLFRKPRVMQLENQ